MRTKSTANQITAVVVGVLLAVTVALADEEEEGRPPCVSDTPIQGDRVIIGSGCSTWTRPYWPYTSQCCQYVIYKLVGSSDTYTLRSGWIDGESCTWYGYFSCPTYVGQYPPGDN